MIDRLIDVVIPTIASREESLERLLRSLARSSRRLHTIIVEDSPTCGAGWRKGLGEAVGEYVLYACDDQEFLSPVWADVAIEAVESGFIACPRVWTPDMAIESQGGDMGQLHHANVKPQSDWTLVDYTTVPFLKRELAEEIGMLDIHYCSDVWVSYRGRQLGWETALRHSYDVRHYREAAGRGAGMGEHERNEMDEATMREELEKCESSSRAA